MSPFLHWSKNSMPLTDNACKWPMKLEGSTEMKRRSVMIPVSMLLNSSLVWAPDMWPAKQTHAFWLLLPSSNSAGFPPAKAHLPRSRCPPRAANSSRAAPRSPRATRCHSASHLPGGSRDLCLGGGKRIKWQSHRACSASTPQSLPGLSAQDQSYTYYDAPSPSSLIPSAGIWTAII